MKVRVKKHWLLLAAFLALMAGVLWATRPGLAQSGSAHTGGRAVTPCVDGLADIYPCHNVDILAHLSLSEIGAVDETIKGNDHWGWTDPDTGREYVIFGLTDSTSFIDITDHQNPIYLGNLPGRDGISTWRDIKVYQNYAYIVSDIPTQAGMQVFDLTQLRNVVNPPVTFSETNHYDGFGPGHNLWINEATGYLYAFRSDSCNAAIHMVDLQDPANPTFAGCFDEGDAPLSDAECVIYSGPDTDYTGQEICFTGSDDNVSIGNVNDKANPYLISHFIYPGIARAHQGALTADQRFWLLSDTMDENNFGHNTRTYAFDVADLDAPVFLGYYEHATTARDHNVYIIGNYAYETNWRAGLRILDISSLPSTNFTEVAYFDVDPTSDSIAMTGSWSNYPWWTDGTVTVSDTEQGLFILQPQLAPTDVSLIGLDGQVATPAGAWLAALLTATLLLAVAIWYLRRRSHA